MRTITFKLLTNTTTTTESVYGQAFAQDDNATTLVFDFTGTDCATWDKWLDLSMSDMTKDTQSLGADAIVSFVLKPEHTKRGDLRVNPYAKSGTSRVGYPIQVLKVERQLNNSVVDASAQQSMIDYFDVALAVKAVTVETLPAGSQATASVTKEADGMTIGFGIPKGDDGEQGIPTTKAGLGLENVDNTSDANKPVSTAQALAINELDVVKATKPYREQVDFVEYIKRQKTYQMKYSKGYFGLNAHFYDGQEIITHSFIKESEDDFIKWMKSIIGEGVTDRKLIVDISSYADLVRTGTWVGSLNYYTTQVGATFQTSIIGSAIYMYHYADNRGGVWQFVIDGDVANPINISVFSAGATSKETLVKDGLNPHDTHTVLATFMGADPLNPPSGGTARGWLSDDPSFTNGQTRAIHSSFKSSANLDLLNYGSNRTIAFLCTYGGNSTYIPSHLGVASVTKIDEPIYQINGVVVDYATMPSFVLNDCDEIKITQHFYGVVSATNIIECWTYTTIKSDGTIVNEGKFNALQNFTLVNGYAGMLPLPTGILNKAVSSFGNIGLNDSYTRLNFLEELNEAISICGIDETRKDYVCAMSIDRPLFTNRLRENDSYVDYLWANRDATYMKFYNEVLNNKAITTGYTYRYYLRHTVAYLENIHDLVIDLVS